MGKNGPAENLRAIRRARGLSQSEAALQLGVHSVTLARVELNQAVPSLYLAIAIELWSDGYLPCIDWRARMPERFSQELSS